MHYSCLVVGDDVDALLAPYSEHLTVDPYRDYLDAEDVRLMADEFGLPVEALDRLAEKLPEWREAEGGVDAGRLFVWSTANPRSKWDWYATGGRFGSFLELREPRMPTGWRSWFRRTPDTHTTRARKREVVLESLLAEPPAAILFAGEWREAPISLGRPPPEWSVEFAEVLASVPDDALLNAMDLHS